MYEELVKYKTGNKISIPVTYHLLDSAPIESNHQIIEYQLKFED
jgi:hypothetical protein